MEEQQKPKASDAKFFFALMMFLLMVGCVFKGNYTGAIYFLLVLKFI